MEQTSIFEDCFREVEQTVSISEDCFREVEQTGEYFYFGGEYF